MLNKMICLLKDSLSKENLLKSKSLMRVKIHNRRSRVRVLALESMKLKVMRNNQ